MLRIIENKKGSVKKYLLTFPVFNIMFDLVFINISLVPLEPSKMSKFLFHRFKVYMTMIYKSRFLKER